MKFSIQAQLEALGIVGQTYKSGRELLVLCPFHNDHTPSMSINLEDGRWYCFQESRGGTYIELVSELKRDNNFSVATAEPYQAQEIPMLQSWADRGFTTAMLLKWGIQWDEDVHAMRIPVLTDGGAIVAHIWRAPEGVEPKYRYDAGFAKSNALFGLWRLPNPCRERVVLVEGPLDAIWVQDCGIPCVAILGSSLSEDQLDLLLAHGIRKVVLCFDNDSAGVQATYNARGILKKAGLWAYQAHLPGRYKDIQEVEHGAVEAVIASAELSVNGTGTVHPRFQRWLGGAKQVASIWRKR